MHIFRTLCIILLENTWELDYEERVAAFMSKYKMQDS